MAGKKSVEVESVLQPERVLAIDAAGLDEIAAAIASKNDEIAKEASGPAGRAFRSFRLTEVCELTGLNENQVRTWRQKNKETLDAYRSAVQAGDANMAQLPLTLAEIHRMLDDLGCRPRRPAGSRAIRIGVFNFKGGSTKSTTTMHAATYLAMQGWRVLVIDADPQGSLSTMFGMNPEDMDDIHTLGPAFASVNSDDLFNGASLSPLPTHIDGLDILPASLEMIQADFDVAAAFLEDETTARGFYTIVARALATVENAYDVILVDGAPAFSFSAVATMWAVDGMVVPVPPASPDFKATGAFCSMAARTMGQLAVREGRPERQWAPFMFLHNRVKPRASTDLVLSLSHEAFGRFRINEQIADSSAVPNSLVMLKSVFEATGADVDTRALRLARAAYTAFGQRLERAIQAAWEAGFARAGTQP